MQGNGHYPACSVPGFAAVCLYLPHRNPVGARYFYGSMAAFYPQLPIHNGFWVKFGDGAGSMKKVPVFSPCVQCSNQKNPPRLRMRGIGRPECRYTARGIITCLLLPPRNTTGAVLSPSTTSTATSAALSARSPCTSWSLKKVSRTGSPATAAGTPAR